MKDWQQGAVIALVGMLAGVAVAAPTLPAFKADWNSNPDLSDPAKEIAWLARIHAQLDGIAAKLPEPAGKSTGGLQVETETVIVGHTTQPLPGGVKKIVFPNAFQKTPVVTIQLASFFVGKESEIIAKAEKITEKGFDLRVTGSNFSKLDVTYVAVSK